SHQQYSFRLPDGTSGTGRLLVTVQTDVYNQVFESNGTGTAESNNTATVTGTSVLAPYPDLQVTSLAVTPTSGLRSGARLVVSWNDSNTGTGPVGDAFNDHVVIVNTTTGQTLAATDVLYDPGAAGNGPIAAGGLRARRFDFTLPQGTPGAGTVQFTVTTNY